MCKIIILEPNQEVPYAKLENAVFNNPHGWGVILKDTVAKKLEVKRFLDPSEKGTNPETVAKFLEKNKDVQRFLHLRFKTEGAVSMENVQPFCSYYTDKREVYFCHNGTLYEYTNKQEPDKSDSFRFNAEILQPLLLRVHGEKGAGDYTDPVVLGIINKYFGIAGHNKGLIVSNDLDYKLLNEKEWKKIKFGNHEIVCSNLEYFDELKRGPEYEARKKQVQSPFRQDNQNAPTSWPLKKMDEVDFSPKKLLGDEPNKIFEDMKLYDDDGVLSLSNLTEKEFRYIIDKSPETAAALMLMVTSEMRKAYDAFKDMEDRRDKASKIIAEMKKNEEVKQVA